MNHFNKFAGVKVIEELTADHIYLWLSSMNVSNQTKLTRLKCLKTFFSRCFNNAWIEVDFLNNLKIKVDNLVKKEKLIEK